MREDGRRAAGRERRGDVGNLWPYNSRRQHDEAKRLAERAVTNALLMGVLERQPCEVCGISLSEAHHSDYHKPLEVRWLCRPHHRQADAQRITDRTGERQEVRQHIYRNRRAGTSIPPLIRSVTAQVRAEMDAQGLTQRELARLCGVSQPMVHRWFAAGFRSFDSLLRVAAVLGMDVKVDASPAARDQETPHVRNSADDGFGALGVDWAGGGTGRGGDVERLRAAP